MSTVGLLNLSLKMLNPSIRNLTHKSLPISSSISIKLQYNHSKYSYHGGRHFKKYFRDDPMSSGHAVKPHYKFSYDMMGHPIGQSRTIPEVDFTRQIPQLHAPKYQDYERQIEASRRMQLIEEQEKPKVGLLEMERDELTETSSSTSELAEIDPLAVEKPIADYWANPSEITQEYGYDENADLQYYSTPRTKVLEFHTAETSGRPLVETPEPVFVPDEHWVWEDNVEAQQDAMIYEETVMDS